MADILMAVSKQLSHKKLGKNKIDLFTQRQTMRYHLLGEHLPTLPLPLYPTAALSTSKVRRADLLYCQRVQRARVNSISPCE